MTKDGLPNFADRLIKAGEKNINWGSTETQFTHAQAISTVGMSSLVAGIAIAKVAGDIDPSFPTGETTAKLLVDHANQIKNHCLRYVDLLNNGEPGVKGLQIGPNLEGETVYGLAGDPDYNQPITEIAKRIVEPNRLDTTPQCVIAYGEDTTVGKVITTTAREKAIAQGLIDIVSKATKPFRQSSVALLSTTIASATQALWYRHKGWLDKKITNSTSVAWLGKQQVRLGRLLKG